jgi:L-rhamnose-H+ transport protein
MNPLFGVLLMAVGSACAASFYVPIRKVKSWSWETYWIVQGIASWILAPMIFAVLTVPHLSSVISNVPTSCLLACMFWGALWGVGGLTFGLSMRYLGVALGQSIALGFCGAFGTLIPPMVAGQDLFSSREGLIMLIGVAISIAGIAIVGYAGALKSQSMSEEDKKKAVKEFALKKGLLIAVVAGVMSACMSYGINGLHGILDAGNLIQAEAVKQGTNPLFVTSPVFIFVMFGGFLTNFVYCFYLSVKNKSYKDFTTVSGNILLMNVLFSFLGGTLWFLQFFFFGMGQSLLPVTLLAFGWSILMALNIVFSNVWGIILNEWKGSSRKTILVLSIGLVVLLLSIFVIKL